MCCSTSLKNGSFFLFNSTHKSMKKKWFNQFSILCWNGGKILRVMKLVIVMTFFCTLQLSASIVLSQDKKLSINVRNTRIADVLSQIESQTSYKFAYSSQFIDMQREVSLNVDNAVMQDVLNKLFSGTAIEYKVENEFVILIPRIDQNQSGSGNAQQQGKSVTGTIVDKNGEALPGVSVVIKGSASGTITDFNGKFALQGIKNEDVLVISFVGMVQQELEVGSKNIFNVVLEESITGLDEVVVIGYGFQKKSDVSGAISQVKATDMVNRTITRPEQALQGKTAGVQIIQTSGAPGASPQVRVRGYSSNSSSSPLFIVDGVRSTNIGGLDPNDIESMEVLKDAASAAIYGAEAGNGVILITTRKGKSGVSKVTYSYQYLTQSLARIPEMLNAQEYITYMREGNTFPQSKIDSDWDGVTNTKWTDIAFENSLMQRHNFSFTGGNDKSTFYLSLGYLDNDGIVKGEFDTYTRLTANINADYKVNSWMKVGTTNQIERYKVKSVVENNEYGSLLSAVLQMDPLTKSTYAPNELPALMQNAVNQGFILNRDDNGNYYGVSSFYASEQYHPYIMSSNNEAKNNGFNINGTIYGDLNPVKGLIITSRLGYRFNGATVSNWLKPFYGNATQNRNWANYNATSSTIIYYQWENFANYNLKIGKNYINSMVGMSFSENVNNFVQGTLTAKAPTGQTVITQHAILRNDPLFAYLNFASPSSEKTLAGEETMWRKLGYFGRIEYNYESKYYLMGSLRADAADLAYLPSSNRWGYFPSVSGAWTISNEKFMEGAKKYVSFLKLRSSWGQNGSMGPLGNYIYGTTIGTSGLYPFTDGINYVTGARPTSMGNDELKWETAEQLNLGFDARLLDSRLSLSVDYFDKTTKDLLVTGSTPSLIIGGTTSPINAGTVKNTGLEFELGWKDNVGGFEYEVRGNLATLKNEVTFLEKSLARLNGTNFHTNVVTVFQKGYPVYYFYGYKLDKINPNNGDPLFIDKLSVDTNGDGIFDAGDGLINDNDKTYIGDAIPDYTYGITLSGAYKGFDLTLFGTGSKGNQVFMGIARADYPAGNKIKEVFYNNRWTTPGQVTSIPRAASSGLDKYLVSDAMVFDGSYFKIKQIQLGYTVPKSILKKAFMQNLRAYISLDDFITFSNYPGFDPEASAGAAISGMGVDKGSYPTSKKFVFGVTIDF